MRLFLRTNRPLLCMLTCAVGVVCAIYIVDYLPINDGPHHAYLGFVRARIDQEPFSRYYQASYPFTGWLWPALFASLEQLLGWREAYRLSLSVTALSWVLGASLVIRAMPKERQALLWLAGIGGLQWALYMGFLGWLLSAGIGLAVLGLTLRTGSELPRPRQWLLIGFLLALAAASHPFGAQLGGFGLLIHFAFTTPHASWRSHWRQRLPALVLVGVAPLLATAGPAWELANAELPPWPWGYKRFYYPPMVERLQGLIWFYASGPWFRWLPSLLAAGLGVFAATTRWKKISLVERAVLTIALSYLLLAMTTPRHARAWYNFSPRFVPIGLFLAATLIPVERLRKAWTKRATHFALALSYLASTIWAAHHHLNLAENSDRWLAALGAEHSRAGTLLPIVTQAKSDMRVRRRDLAIPFARPHVNSGLVYAMDRSLAAPYSFSTLPSVHAILDRQQFPRTPSRDFQDSLHHLTPKMRHREVVRLSSYGVAFDEVLIVGTPEIIETFIELGYQPIVRRKQLLLGRFVGCPTKVRFSSASSVALEVTVVTFWDPYDRAVAVDENWKPQSLPAVRNLPHAGCGPIRVRFSFADPTLRCQQADQRGDIRATGGDTIACDVTQQKE